MASASIPETCCVKLGRTLNSLSAFLHSGVYMGTSELNAEANPTMDIPSHPAGGGRGGVVSRYSQSFQCYLADFTLNFTLARGEILRR